MDITDRFMARKESESKRYLNALADVYDKIFEFNLETDTVKCLHCSDSSYFKLFENIAVRTDDALERWLFDSVDDSNKDVIKFTDQINNLCDKWQ